MWNPFKIGRKAKQTIEVVGDAREFKGAVGPAVDQMRTIVDLYRKAREDGNISEQEWQRIFSAVDGSIDELERLAISADNLQESVKDLL